MPARKIFAAARDPAVANELLVGRAAGDECAERFVLPVAGDESAIAEIDLDPTTCGLT